MQTSYYSGSEMLILGPKDIGGITSTQTLVYSSQPKCTYLELRKRLIDALKTDNGKKLT